ncbi:unnamed protein product [Protopolystoma xenopodis]|uniref:Uncharacterized protein n=1 Tax=Protopolystoma xenopodis TaxID=117903 RepID=A0A448WRG0_9PLAT|nr:unnamed protein product [Protopolystoma xenopodis]
MFSSDQLTSGVERRLDALQMASGTGGGEVYASLNPFCNHTLLGEIRGLRIESSTDDIRSISRASPNALVIGSSLICICDCISRSDLRLRITALNLRQHPWQSLPTSSTEAMRLCFRADSKSTSSICVVPLQHPIYCYLWVDCIAPAPSFLSILLIKHSLC